MKHYTKIFILIFMSIMLSACGSNTSVQNVSETGQNPLLIPALIDSRTTPEIELVMQNGAHEFYAALGGADCYPPFYRQAMHRQSRIEPGNTRPEHGNSSPFNGTW